MKQVDKINPAQKQTSFQYCALSFLPWKNPVATADGYIFEITHVIPFIKKYGIHPVTKEELKIGDLVKLNFQRNEKGEYLCPISKKVLNESSHIIAIKESGNVYSFESYDELN